MINLISLDTNVKLGFDFLEKLPDDFDVAKSKFEKWVPFVLMLSFPEKTIGITEDIRAYMTVYEVEKRYNGLKRLIDGVDGRFSHYSSESLYEVNFEYVPEDECFDVELWFMVAECPDGRIIGYRIGFGFVTGRNDVKKFLEEFKERFVLLCPQYSLG